MAKTAQLKPPDSVEREYTRLLQWLARQIAKHTRAIVLPKLPTLMAKGKAELRGDGYSEDLAVIMAALLDAILRDTSVVELRLPGMFGLLSKFNDRAFIMAVKAASGVTLPPAIPGARPSLLGVNVYRGEPWLADLQKAWVTQNVSLVQSIPTQFHSQLDTIIRNGVFNGDSVKSVADKIEKQFGVTKNRATLIAQDQILSANARLTQARAQEIGVKDYEWATVGDSRVRPEHAELNGRRFSFDKPPAEGNPGTPIRCRCRANLILPEFD